MSQPLSKYAAAARFERSTVDMAADRPILERFVIVTELKDSSHVVLGQSTVAPSKKDIRSRRRGSPADPGVETVINAFRSRSSQDSDDANYRI
jgi:hypothetical protein